MNPELDLVLDRELPVPVSIVWEAWTNPELLKIWFCPLPWRITSVDLDLQPGGRFNFVMEGPNGERSENKGCYLEVVPMKRIVSTDALHEGYRPSGNPGFMSAIVSFEDRGDTCRYTATALHANPEVRKQHEEMGFHDGWGAACDQLVELCQSLLKDRS